MLTPRLLQSLLLVQGVQECVDVLQIGVWFWFEQSVLVVHAAVQRLVVVEQV